VTGRNPHYQYNCAKNIVLKTERGVSVSKSQLEEKKPREVFVGHMHEPNVNDELIMNYE
jgi:hypothetical protein